MLNCTVWSFLKHLYYFFHWILIVTDVNTPIKFYYKMRITEKKKWNRNLRTNWWVSSLLSPEYPMKTSLSSCRGQNMVIWEGFQIRWDFRSQSWIKNYEILVQSFVSLQSLIFIYRDLKTKPETKTKAKACPKHKDLSNCRVLEAVKSSKAPDMV